MSASAPQRVPGMSGRETDRSPLLRVAAAQPTTFIREDGELLRFESVASFIAWWDAQQRSKAEGGSEEYV